MSELITGLIVTLAVVFLGRRLLASFKGEGGCGGCSGCSQAVPELVDIEEPR